MPDWILPAAAAAPARIGVALYERFSNHCLANAVEPLRAANDILGRRAYDWHLVTPDGGPVASSSGLPVAPAAALGEAPGGDALLVMPSYGHRGHEAHGRALRRAAARYRIVAGLDAGAWLLAAAGLLDGRAATIHHDLHDAFAERFPQVRPRRARWVEDGDRLTAGGAASAFDLVIHLVARAHGTALTTEIAALFLLGEPLAVQASGDRHVARALAAMEAHLEAPLPIPAVARHAGCRQRDLEARFALALGATPRAAYRRVRLAAGRRLLREGGMSVAEVALRCGYADPSAFARAVRAEFGAPPRAWR